MATTEETRNSRTSRRGGSRPDSRADDAERRELIESHLGLAKHLARRFLNRGESYDDLVQVSCLALVKAADAFDPEMGTKFGTYATKTIVGELKRHFRDRGWAVRPPRRLQELSLELAKAIEDLSHRFGRSPTIAELASETGSSEEKVIQAIEATSAYRTTSLDGSPSEDGEPLSERLESIDSGFTHAEWRVVLSPLLDALPERKREVMKLRFSEGLSQAQIARRIGVSQMQVSRLLTSSLSELRRGCLLP
jgi:RNA polymerase sigma-B factor